MGRSAAVARGKGGITRKVGAACRFGMQVVYRARPDSSLLVLLVRDFLFSCAHFGVRRLVAAFFFFVVECRKEKKSKAVTSHRTPKLGCGRRPRRLTASRRRLRGVGVTHAHRSDVVAFGLPLN